MRPFLDRGMRKSFIFIDIFVSLLIQCLLGLTTCAVLFILYGLRVVLDYLLALKQKVHFRLSESLIPPRNPGPG